MSGAFETVVQTLEEIGFDYMAGPEKSRIFLPAAGRHGSYLHQVWVREDSCQLFGYTSSPLLVPESKRVKVAEYLTRANYGLRLGNFEMDFRDGEVRYKTAIDYTGHVVAPEQIRTLVLVNLATFDRYFGGLTEVIFSQVSPAAAVACVEGAPADDHQASSSPGFDDSRRLRPPHPRWN